MVSKKDQEAESSAQQFAVIYRAEKNLTKLGKIEPSRLNRSLGRETTHAVLHPKKRVCAFYTIKEMCGSCIYSFLMDVSSVGVTTTMTKGSDLTLGSIPLGTFAVVTV